MSQFIPVVLVIHLFIALALIGIVLMQKSEGGALGIGSGGGAGGFLTGRGTANLLTRTTAALALGFFCTSMLLTILSGGADRAASRFGQPPAATNAGTKEAGDGKTDTPKAGGVLDSIRSGRGTAPAVPQGQ